MYQLRCPPGIPNTFFTSLNPPFYLYAFEDSFSSAKYSNPYFDRSELSSNMIECVLSV